MKLISILLTALLLVASATAEVCSQKHGIELHDYHGRTILPAHTCNIFLNTTDFYDEPDVVLPGLYTNNTQKFTLMLLEKHNVPREVYRLHWLVANISPLNHSLVRNRTSLALHPYSKLKAPDFGYSNYTLTVYKQNMSGPLIVTRPGDPENFWPDVWLHSLGTSVAKEYTRTWFRINGTSVSRPPNPPSPGFAIPHPPVSYPPPPPQVSQGTVGSMGRNNYTYGNHTNGSYPQPPPPFYPQPPPPYHPQPPPPYHPQPAPPYNPHQTPSRPYRGGAVTHYVEFSLLLAPFLFFFYLN